jgi:cytochrome c-type biogenesis protein CcmH/NrfF
VTLATFARPGGRLSVPKDLVERAPACGRRARVPLGVLIAIAVAGPAAGASAAVAHTSLPTIERQVMCVTCKIPLNVAQSSQADRERAFIQGLIDRGENEAQIKSALVGQYGPTVLGLPRAHGFDLTVYLVPLAVLLALLATLALVLPRWRHHARARQAAPETPVPTLAAGDAARLDADLARFD